MSKVTYTPAAHDTVVVNGKTVPHPATVVAGVTFPAGVAVSLPPHKEWLAEKLKNNPWFRVEQDQPAQEGPSVEMSAPVPSVEPAAQKAARRKSQPPSEPAS